MILLQTRARIIFNCPAKPQSKTHRTIADEPWTAEGVVPDKTLNFKPWLESPDIHRVWGWGDTQVHLLRGVARQYPCLFRHFAPCASGSISAAHVNFSRIQLEGCSGPYSAPAPPPPGGGFAPRLGGGAMLIVELGVESFGDCGS